MRERFVITITNADTIYKNFTSAVIMNNYLEDLMIDITNYFHNVICTGNLCNGSLSGSWAIKFQYGQNHVCTHNLITDYAVGIYWEYGYW